MLAYEVSIRYLNSGNVSVSSVLLVKYYSVDQIEKNEMGGACSTYGGEVRCVQDFGGEIYRKETTWKTQA